MDLVVQSPDELIAAVPHVLGFKPEESIVLMPITKGLPCARVDLPTTASDRDGVSRALRGPYGQHARPGAMVALVCVTEDRRAAELASQHIAAGLAEVGVDTKLRLWANGQRWVELDTGASGYQSQQAADRMAATTVLAGAVQPAANRDSLAASLAGDHEPLAAVLPSARAAAESSTPGRERDWALDRLEQFHADGRRLSDPEAARLLVAVKTTATRDALWEDMSRENTSSHIALWTDLTRRAPDEVRAAPAALLGFSSWLKGDGARAWCALDQVPADQPYPLAAIVASALQNGLHPREWERANATMREIAGELDESYVPDRRLGRADRHLDDHGMPGGPRPGDGPNRAAPGR